MSLAQVQSALAEAVVGAVGGLPLAAENEAFTPPDSGPWVKTTFVPNTPEVDTLGSTGVDRVQGFTQVDYNSELGEGDAAARDFYETVRSSFPAGARLNYGGQVVTIMRCGRSQGRNVDRWYRTSITVYWYAQIPR